MKQRIIKIGVFILLLAILIPNQVSAISSSGGYTIQVYNIDMKVNENNTFDITETITAYFTGNNKHGIYRKIPLKNSVTRTDGTKSNNNAKITNISVNDNFKTYNESGYKVIKIGDADKTVSGAKTYTIKYTYNIGKDPLKNADELYFNLIGNEWDTSISYVAFNITMPKEFDKTLLGFSSGKTGSTNSSNVLYNVNGNVISGSLKNSLSSGEALTVRLTLPEGYFVGAKNNFDNIMLLRITTSIICVLIAYLIWNKYGRDEITIDTVEFYPPEGLNSAEIAYIYKGYSEDRDIISLLIYLANKGYLKIEEIEKKALIGKYKSFKIIKLKEYDGDNENEMQFFNDLFKSKELISIEELKQLKNKTKMSDLYKMKEEVTKDDLYNRFYETLNIIKKNLNRKKNKEKIFEKSSLNKRGIIIFMIVLIYILMSGFTITNGTIVIGFILMMCLIALYSMPNVLTVILNSITFIILGFYTMRISAGTFSISLLIEFLIHSICIVLLIIFVSIVRKRTKYGTEMLGKIKGFKNFLEIAEKPKLEQLVMKDPEYFYNILPYTYALGVSSKWMKKFEDIALKAPDWYDAGYADFNTRSFNNFMNSTFYSISSAMSSSPSSDSSGGGSSGGGSGGGGGGSW